MKALLTMLLCWLALPAPGQLNLRNACYVACFLKPMMSGAAYPSGATHYWAMEEGDGLTREDGVGSLDLADGSGAWAQAAGKNNFCAEMTLASGPLETTAFQLGTAWSIVFWFKANTSCDGQTLLRHGAAGVYLLYQSSGAVVFSVDGQVTTLTGDTASSGNWHLVVATLSGTTASISVDGAAFDTGTQVFLNESNTLEILDQVGGVAYAMDEVATFARALTITEVQTIYNGGTGRFGP